MASGSALSLSNGISLPDEDRPKPLRLELHLISVLDGAVVPDAEVQVDHGNSHDDDNSSFVLLSDSRGVVFVELPATPRGLVLHVKHENFVPKLVAWVIELMSPPFPECFTLKMERAHVIGGPYKQHGPAAQVPDKTTPGLKARDMRPT